MIILQIHFNQGTIFGDLKSQPPIPCNTNRPTHRLFEALSPSGERVGRGGYGAVPLSTPARQHAAKPAYLSPEGERE
jgi:hypothetical protein